MASKKEKYLESAQKFLLKGQLDRAIKDYQQVVALEPKEVRYRQRLAELLVRDSRKEEAIIQYEDIGKHYADNSYFLKAIAVYKQIQRLDPGNTAISLTLARLNHQQGLNGNAMAEYGQVVAQMEKEGNLKEALKVLEQMLTVEPGHSATRLKHAEFLAATGSLDAAREAFSSLIASLRNSGDQAALQRVGNRMRELLPDAPEDPLDACALLVASGDLAGAASAVQELLQRDQGSLKAWQLLCEIERRRDNRQALKTAYDQMLKRFPGDVSVVVDAVRASLDAGRFGDATCLLEDNLAAFLSQGQQQDAESLLLAFPAEAAADPRVSALLMRLYEATGAKDKAAALQRASNPGAAGAAPGAAEPPSAFAPAAAASAPSPSEPPSAFAPAASPAPAASAAAPAATPGGELSAPWEEEIELDLDDEPFGLPPAPQENYQAPTSLPEIDLSLDFSLPLDLEDHAAAAAPGGVESAPEVDLSDLSAFTEQPEPVQPALAPAVTEVPAAAASAPSAASEAALSPQGEALPEEDLEIDLDAEELELDWADDEDAAVATLVGQEPAVAALELEDSVAAFDLPDSAPVQDLAHSAPAFDLSAAAPPLDLVEPAPALDPTRSAPALDLDDSAALPVPPAKRHDWDEIFPSVLSNLAAEADQAELESHYDLGIAYKEMGKLKGAIEEFTVAAANPRRWLDCLVLQAMCYRELGEVEQAEDLLRRGHALDVLSEEERNSVGYELAFLHESTGDVEGAIEMYRAVYRCNPAFHDVAQRLSRLAGEEALDIIELELEEE